LRLEWAGGTDPYTVQQKAALGVGAWVNLVVGVNGTNATATLDGAFVFFRVQGQ
jgi:hypothetical protein